MAGPNGDLQTAGKTLRAEGQAIAALADRLDDRFVQAVDLLLACRGQVVLTGIGKAGIVAQKISATLASTGTPSIFLHPVEALHGDLGRLGPGDVVVALSHSGATDELVRLLDHVKRRGAALVAITGTADSPLARHADVAVCYGPVEEACPLGLAPTVSTSCMLAVGDALALAVMRRREFTPEEFAAFHPAGDLGRRLLKVEDAIFFRPGEGLNVVSDAGTLGEALAAAEKQIGRRSGAMLLVDSAGRLSGILTDADLRRLLVRAGGTDVLARPVRELMTRDPIRIRTGELASEALAIIHRHRIDELPVVDAEDRPAGVIDVQDLLGLETLGHG